MLNLISKAMKVGTSMKSLEKTLDNVLNEMNTIYGHLNEEDMKKAADESSQLVSELKASKKKIKETHKFFSASTIIVSLIVSAFMMIWFNNYNTLGSKELIINTQLIASIAINYVVILIVCLGVSYYFWDYLKQRIESYDPDFSKAESFEEKIEMMNESEKHSNRNIILGSIGYISLMFCLVIYSPYLHVIMMPGNTLVQVMVFILSVLLFITLISRIFLEFKLKRVQKNYNKKWKAHESYYQNLNRLNDK